MNLSAVGTHYKTSENVVGICYLVPCLDRQPFVNCVIVLLTYKSLMSVIGNHPFIFGALYPFLVLIRLDLCYTLLYLLIRCGRES